MDGPFGISVGAKPGRVLQVQYEIYSADYSGTTVIPSDATIPQSSEGTALGNGVKITPRSSTSIMLVEGVFNHGAASNVASVVALFRDSETNARQTSWCDIASDVARSAIKLFYIDPAPLRQEQTYKVRYGPSGASTMYLNRITSVADLFGSAFISYLMVMEIDT